MPVEIFTDFKDPNCPLGGLKSGGLAMCPSPDTLGPSLPLEYQLSSKLAMFSWTVLVVLLVFSVSYVWWFSAVNKTVLSPYLDEHYHVGQARAYCEGRFGDWDPKITTPPGLYLLSACLSKVYRRLLGNDRCDLLFFRSLNLLGSVLVLPLQVWDLRKITFFTGAQEEASSPEDFYHPLLNISLFPLFFFFSALYYTDIWSVCFVLAAYRYQRRSSRQTGPPRPWNALSVIVTGLLALLMRQTNIFWLSVFLPGLQAVDCLKNSTKAPFQTRNRQTLSQHIHDVPVSQACLEDYCQTMYSLIEASWRQPLLLAKNLWPYLVLLACFLVFVVVNGGVVLGDKENHVATIHLPQMLYFWTYIVFFSWPIILPHIIQLTSDTSLLRQRKPRLSIAIPCLTAMILAVHYNTIVHPFILADNRHYVFYVFRLSLRNWFIKYAAVPIYFLCAWVAIAALGDAFVQETVQQQQQQQNSKQGANRLGPKQAQSASTHSNVYGNSDERGKASQASFLLVYLASTTLSLITAPLVEPRYFMLPWLIWRLHVQLPRHTQVAPHNHQLANPRSDKTNAIFQVRRMLHVLASLDNSVWLWLETAWFVIINLATAWMFLQRGFEWDISEPGEVQRFMW